MDKSCHSSADSSSTTTATSSSSSSNKDHYLKHLNKISHKISKPINRKPAFDHHHRFNHPPPPPPPPPPSGPTPPPQQQQIQLQAQNLPQQHQPPVYNINKSDFRDVVQKLTGSPAHERFSTPPPIQPPKPPSSRLQRIRPPPLVQISNRPPPLVNDAAAPLLAPPTSAETAAGNFIHSRRGVQLQPLSPLPPFPSVHTAAESPISAYMRYLHSSVSNVESDPKRVSSRSQLVSPRWNNPTQSQAPHPHHQALPPPPQQNFPPPTSASVAQPQFPVPSSPLPFGCLPSPRSPYPMLSPNLLSPTTAAQFGFHQFPVSPRLPVPSPGWKDF